MALGQSSGTLAAARSLGFVGIPRDATSGDINNDGCLDIVAGNEGTYGVYSYLGNGDGTFLAPISFGQDIEPFSVNITVLNGDGNADLVTAGESGNTSNILIGSGNGTFRAAYSYSTGLNVQGNAVILFGSLEPNCSNLHVPKSFVFVFASLFFFSQMFCFLPQLLRC